MNSSKPTQNYLTSKSNAIIFALLNFLSFAKNPSNIKKLIEFIIEEPEDYGNIKRCFKLKPKFYYKNITL